jgi:hypothetical protein
MNKVALSCEDSKIEQYNIPPEEIMKLFDQMSDGLL